MDDLIELTGAHDRHESFYVSAHRIVLVEPVAYVYGNRARARITLEGGETRKCCEEAPEIRRRIQAATTQEDIDG